MVYVSGRFAWTEGYRGRGVKQRDTLMESSRICRIPTYCAVAGVAEPRGRLSSSARTCAKQAPRSGSRENVLDHRGIGG